ncbi:MAG: hypothetical protein FWD08_01220 [Alphaproteobacteria bacterium]|nr:hypothetical protein [Alphaproteobacteria bacterium]
MSLLLRDPNHVLQADLKMLTPFSSITLCGDLILETLPLVRASWPEVDLAQWQEYVQFFSAQPEAKQAGVVGLRDSSGCYCGVFACQIDRDLALSPVLAVQLFTTVDVANSPRTLKALLDIVEARASELGCLAVKIYLSDGQTKLASRLRALGIMEEFSQFYKKVGSQPARN